MISGTELLMGLFVLIASVYIEHRMVVAKVSCHLLHSMVNMFAIAVIIGESSVYQTPWALSALLLFTSAGLVTVPRRTCTVRVLTILVFALGCVLKSVTCDLDLTPTEYIWQLYVPVVILAFNLFIVEHKVDRSNDVLL